MDCHVHTEASYDCDAAVADVLDAAARAGLDGVVVTDHDEIEASLRAARLAPDYGLVGVPGVEVSTADGHLLAVGVTDRPAPGSSLADTVTAVRERGGVAVVPHPFQRTRHGVSGRAIVDCDGVETFNAHTLIGARNRQAARFAARRRLPAFGGSDAHRPGIVGRAHTVVEVPDAADRDLTAESVVAAMREGRTRAVGERAPIRRYVGKLAEPLRLRLAVGTR